MVGTPFLLADDWRRGALVGAEGALGVAFDQVGGAFALEVRVALRSVARGADGGAGWRSDRYPPAGYVRRLGRKKLRDDSHLCRGPGRAGGSIVPPGAGPPEVATVDAGAPLCPALIVWRLPPGNVVPECG